MASDCETARAGRKREVFSLWTLLVTFGVLLALFSSAAEAQQRQEALTREKDEPPYLLVASVYRIYRMPPNGSELRTLVRDTGIQAVACHYRLGYIFWTNSMQHSIKRAMLNGTNVTQFVTGDIGYPADLAVDWIHDKIYWTDTDLHRIEEVDILTQERRIVVQMDVRSRPLGLAVYPLENDGLLYWMDNGRRTLERSLAINSSHATLHGNLPCALPLTLDHQHRTIYWIDICHYSIESLHINGTNHAFTIEGNLDSVAFSNGITQFDDVIYWTQPLKVNRKIGNDVQVIYTGPNNETFRDIEVVHPRSQPTVEELRLSEPEVVSACRTTCENGGECVLPGLCMCRDGWEGITCTEDVDECQTTNGGCQHVCSNVEGSFQCFCREGYRLGPDGTTCIDIDECSEGAHNCQEVCVNTVGSYQCSCRAGFTLTSDGSTCQGSSPIVPSPIVNPPPSFIGSGTPPESTLEGAWKIETANSAASPTPLTRETPLGIVFRPIEEGGIKAFPTQVSLSHTFDPSATIHLDNLRPSSARVSPTITSLDLERMSTDQPATTHYLGPSTTLKNHISTTAPENTPSLTRFESVLQTPENTPSLTRFESNLDVLQTPLPTTTHTNTPGPGGIGVPPIIRGIDEKGADEETDSLVIIIPVTVVAGLILLSICLFLFSAVYVHYKKHRRGSYSFANPVALDITTEVPTNTLKRGRVTRTSFRQIGCTPPIPTTIAILSPHRNSTCSALSGSDSFEWSHN